MEFTKKALELLEFADVDQEQVIKVVEESLVQPSDAYFRDEELYDTATLAFHTPAWSLTDEYILGQANYRAALEILGEYGAEAATVGHWTYSTFECIKVPMLSRKRKITAAAVMLAELVAKMDAYPVLDEDLWSELEWEVNERAMTNAIYYFEQDNEVTLEDWQKEKISELYWEDYYGYHEAGYIEDEKFQEVVDKVVNGEVQLTQEVSLF